MLPRRLAPVLPSPYSSIFLQSKKAFQKNERHSEFHRHPFGHCECFAPAAPRRAWVLVSVPIWGLPLTRPLPVLGLVSRYLTNSLIGCEHILRRQAFQQNSIPAQIAYGVLFPVSRGYPPPEGSLLTCYSAFYRDCSLISMA